MTEDGLKSVIVKVGLTALVLACVGNVRDKPSDNRNTTVQVVEAAGQNTTHPRVCGILTRVLLKSLSVKEELLVLAKVPELNRRTSCCLATLINAYAVLCASKAKPESPAEGDAARQSH